MKTITKQNKYNAITHIKQSKQKNNKNKQTTNNNRE